MMSSLDAGVLAGPRRGRKAGIHRTPDRGLRPLPGPVRPSAGAAVDADRRSSSAAAPGGPRSPRSSRAASTSPVLEAGPRVPPASP
ncbi:MAG: hypothetical protein MZU84_06005 [Sphingobacterium sp.]|nr:hypothetical protein [Sphingobacterium sp.]